MTENPELEEFRQQIEELRKHTLLSRHITQADNINLGDLSLDDLVNLCRDKVAYYLLIAAAKLNRTTLKQAIEEAETQIVPQTQRKAYAIQKRLPKRCRFGEIAQTAVTLRTADLSRKASGGIEGLFRERLKAEGIAIVMSPPVRQVPGLLVAKRKPDGIYPDPASGQAPTVYLEIKNVRRVSDDIQKRLYEVAEASLEMKFLYGNLQLTGQSLALTLDAINNSAKLRETLRAQILASPPAVVVLFLCARSEAERYRAGAEAFVDRVFFQEEIDECLAYLKSKLPSPTTAVAVKAKAPPRKR